jgi:CHAD domain-containing protein
MARSKWIRLKSRREKVHRVVARMLRSRLGAISHFLPLAARKAAENVEYVHQLRVWTRRADAVVDLCGKLLPKRERKRLDQQLELLRDAAGSARDQDVLLERIKQLKPGLGREHLLQEAESRRQVAQVAIETANRELQGAKMLTKDSQEILRRVQRKRKQGALSERFDKWAAQRFGRLVKKFLARMDEDLADLAKLHKFRIAGKRLRYALELTAGCFFGKSTLTRTYRQLDRLQTQLGGINDMRNLISEIERSLAATKRRPLQAQLKRLLSAERRRLANAQAAWEGEWKARNAKRLKGQLKRCR